MRVLGHILQYRAAFDFIRTQSEPLKRRMPGMEFNKDGKEKRNRLIRLAL